MTSQSINFTGTGNQTVIDVTTGDGVEVYDYYLIVSGAGTVTLKDEAGTVFGIYTISAGDVTAGANRIPAGPLGDGSRRFVGKGDIILGMSTSLTVTGHMTYSIQPR